MNDAYMALAELLVPGSGGRGLERVLEALPELEEPLRALVETAALAPSPADALAEMDGEARELLALAVAGGYLTDPEVLRELGYPGRPAVPVEDDLDAEAIALLDVVRARGRVYRE